MVKMATKGDSIRASTTSHILAVRSDVIRRRCFFRSRQAPVQNSSRTSWKPVWMAVLARSSWRVQPWDGPDCAWVRPKKILLPASWVI